VLIPGWLGVYYYQEFTHKHHDIWIANLMVTNMIASVLSTFISSALMIGFAMSIKGMYVALRATTGKCRNFII